ncbi:MAG: DUF4339 domain-containing protein [Pedosphaera sp.]|nr:DUF4339 domain-containing protein [Pedosphaera sp.]
MGTLTPASNPAMYKIIGTDGKEYGPVAADVLRGWLAQGRVSGQTQVRAEGATDWKRFDQLPEFRADLAAAPPPVVGTSAPAGNDGLNVIIPYKNVRALVAYYLGVFSLIPFVGIPLGLAGFVLGILGLRYRRQHPTAGGVVHAWIGIILGGICGFGWLALVLLGVIAALRTH